MTEPLSVATLVARDDDVIDRLVGIAPGDRLDAVRRHRSQAREQAQLSWRALFAPVEPAPGSVSRRERLAVAAFATQLYQQREAAAFYAQLLQTEDTALAAAVAEQAQRALKAGAAGPYGHYPAGPLSAEDQPGPAWAADAEAQAVLGARLAAGLAHVHLLVLHPRDAKAAHLQALLDAGWPETDIVVLSQLVAFLAFQVRVVAGLRALAAAGAPAAAVSETSEVPA